MEMQISVRDFVEFLLRSGDITRRGERVKEDAMQEGARIHRLIQNRMGESYRAEVPIAHRIDCGEYTIKIEGRADGVISGEPLVIDEIKSTYRDLDKITEPIPVHLAQARCYAYFYAETYRQREMGVRLTYCNIETEQIKYFEQTNTREELENWFMTLMSEYKKWTDFSYEWRKKRNASIRKVEFPFPYRDGQKELVTQVYQTICHKRKLFIQAPTGVGKTLSTIFPAVKAVGEGKADKIFYLTAKTITGSVAANALGLLRENGLAYKSVVLMAREKICFMPEKDCDPETCPYAKGHFDRINDAVFDLLVQEERFDRDTITGYAQKHLVCPFEMGLDISLFSDLIICDYNYLFDPYAYLRRYFAQGVKGEYLFLLDEAHNLVERGRDMYSAELVKEDFLALKKLVKPFSAKIAKALDACNRELLLLKRQCDRECVHADTSSLILTIERLANHISGYLEDNDDSPVRKEVLEFYFKISRFLDVNELLDDNYVTYSRLQEDETFLLRHYCVDPSGRLAECMAKGVSTILFSATFLPIQYYKSLLGGDPEDFEVYAHTTFDASRCKLLIGNQVTSKYTMRGKEQYDRISSYIHEIVSARKGHYLVFFPSHYFLEEVYLSYLTAYGTGDVSCMVQSEYMSEEDRMDFLSRFECEDEDRLVGFCVLGGIFGEGIDLAGERLIGTLIVGTGIPQVCFERELLKEHFDREGKNGFDYAYRFPGMNKVLQAAGRVIRTNEDTGMIALLDERFLEYSYKRLFPREWEKYQVVSVQECRGALDTFWRSFVEA